MLLGRTVSRAKWNASSELALDEVAADTVTSDLRTTKNTLSMWAGDGPAESLVDDTALACAAARDRADSIDVVWLDRSALVAAGLAIESTAGHTPVADLVERHADVVRLDIVRLGKVAALIADAIRLRSQVKRITRAKVLDLLVAAVNKGRLPLAELKQPLQDEVRAHSAKSK